MYQCEQSFLQEFSEQWWAYICPRGPSFFRIFCFLFCCWALVQFALPSDWTKRNKEADQISWSQANPTTCCSCIFSRCFRDMDCVLTSALLPHTKDPQQQHETIWPLELLPSPCCFLPSNLANTGTYCTTLQLCIKQTISQPCIKSINLESQNQRPATSCSVLCQTLCQALDYLSSLICALIYIIREYNIYIIREWWKD